MNSYECSIEKNPSSSLDIHLISLLAEIELRIADAIEDKSTGLEELNTRDIIVMIATNVIMHLMGLSLSTTNQTNIRLTEVKACLDEIKETSLKLWNAVEAARADEEIAH